MNKCKHENTVFGELPELTDYEYCVDCKKSRAIYDDFSPSEWTDNALTTKFQTALDLIHHAADENERLKKEIEVNAGILNRERLAGLEMAFDIKQLASELAEIKISGVTLKTQDRIGSLVEKKIEEISGDKITIDGSGCESGDPVELTLAEISQGFNYLVDEVIQPLKAELAKHELVSVEDELPTENGVYLVYIPNQQPKTCYRGSESVVDSYHFGCQIRLATHWMPIPPLPESEAQND